MAREILLTHDYPYPPEEVWAVLTDSAELAAWLMPNDFAPRVGHEFTMTTKPRFRFDGVIRCTVLALDPPRRMVWSWRGGALVSELSFDLAATAGGTRLTLRQTGFDGLGNFVAWLALREGWRRKVLARIGVRVEARRR